MSPSERFAMLLESLSTIGKNFLWAFIIYLALRGMGYALTRIVKKDIPGWIHPILGVALFTGIGGWLDLWHLATMPNLTLLALIGLGGTGLEAYDRWKSKNWEFQTSYLWLLIPIVLSIYPTFPDLLCFDDNNGYFPVCNEMTVSGTSWAPLSLRRALTFGGQFPLQTLGMLFTQDRGGWLYDNLVATFIFAGLSIQLIKKNRAPTGILAACVLPLLPQACINSAPGQLVTLLLLGAVCLKEPNFQTLLLGAALTLRTQSIVFIAALLAWDLFQPNWKTAIQRPLYKILGIFLFCLPFALNSWEQFKTPSPLVLPGTIDPAYLHLTSPLAETLLALKTTGIEILAPITILVISLFEKSLRRAGTASLLSLAAITYATTELSKDYWIRYSWPFLSVGLIAAIFFWASDRKTQAPWVILLSFSCLTVPFIRIASGWEKIPERLTYIDGFSGENYRMQLQIPEKTGIACIIKRTANLDFRRNKILNLDVFPAIGALPKTTDPQKWREWGKSHAVDYLVHMDFDYKESKQGQSFKESLANPPVSEPHYHKVWIPNRLQTIQTLEALRKTLPYKQFEGYYIFDLRTP